jgi:hypothetical protein
MRTPQEIELLLKPFVAKKMKCGSDSGDDYESSELPEISDGELVAFLEYLKVDDNWDPILNHVYADSAILAFVRNDAITEAFLGVSRYYS